MDVGTNPFVEIREKNKEAWIELSKELSLGVKMFCEIERGEIENPNKYLEALKQAGLVEDTEQFLKEYQAWRKRKRIMDIKRFITNKRIKKELNLK